MKIERKGKSKAPTVIPLQPAFKIYRTLFDRIPALVTIYNIKTGEYKFVNKAVSRLLGYSPELFLKKGTPYIWRLVHPEDVGLIVSKNNEAIKKANDPKTGANYTESITNFEYRLKHKDGRWVWLHTDGGVFSRDNKGKVECVTNISVDITERKNKEFEVNEELKESENKYRTFLNQASEGIWRFALEKPVDIKLPQGKQVSLVFKYGYLADCNDAMAKMYGYTRGSQLLGSKLSDLLIPDDPKNIEFLKAFFLSGYKLTDAESHERDRKGNDKYFLNNLVGIIENGKLFGAWGTQRDMTTVRQAQNDILESEERLRLAIDAGEIGIWDWDMNNKKITWTDKVYEIHGLEKDKFNGTYKEFLSLIHEEDRKRVLNSIKNSINMKIPYSLDFRIVKPDGTIGWISTSAKVIYDNNGKPVRMLGATSDINDRKITEERKDDFIAIAAHELRTPVGAIYLYVQMLKRKILSLNSNTLESTVVKLDDATRRLGKLIEDLLDASRLNRKKESFNIKRTELKQLIEETVAETQKVLKTHKIDMSVPKTKVYVRADREKLKSVIVNLLTNAQKYSPDERTIKVGLSKTASEAIIHVRDYGIGIPPKERKKIFERFYQVTPVTRNYGPGLGLGLFVAKEIINRHKGRIWVESTKHHGSTFFISLPIKTASIK